jgi:hypothetical protein
MNIESDTRTLTHHWGLPRLWLYRQGRPLHGNPRSSVVGPQLPYRLIADFPDVEAFHRYAQDPVHLSVIAEHVRPWLAGRSAIQYQL